MAAKWLLCLPASCLHSRQEKGSGRDEEEGLLLKRIKEKKIFFLFLNSGEVVLLSRLVTVSHWLGLSRASHRGRRGLWVRVGDVDFCARLCVCAWVRWASAGEGIERWGD